MKEANSAALLFPCHGSLLNVIYISEHINSITNLHQWLCRGTLSNEGVETAICLMIMSCRYLLSKLLI